MSISMWVFIIFFTGVEVCGQADAFETIKVMEGDVLSLHPGVDDLKGDDQILWSYESNGLSTLIAKMYHGEINTHYDERFSRRVQLDQKTGVLTISNIRTNESGLFDAFNVINTDISEKKYNVEVYATSLVTVRQSTGTSHASNATIHFQTTEFYSHNEDCLENCGVTEVVIRLALSGLVGIATAVFLVEHLCCSVQGRVQSSV